jgi:hypothetical protein
MGSAVSRRAPSNGGFVVSETWLVDLPLKLEDFVESLIVKGPK